MNRPVSYRLIVLLIGTVCCVQPILLAAPPDKQTYVVTVRPEAAVDGTRVVAQQMAATYGGTVVEGAGGDDTFLISIPKSRASSLAADPHLKSVVPSRKAPVPEDSLETVNWRNGVSYSYDGLGNVRQIGTDTFTYDEASRLVQANVNGVPRVYEYDAYGNRTKCSQLSPNDCQIYSINTTENRNRLAGPGYDAAGNVTTLSNHVYSYDTMNMMTRDTYGPLAREFVYTAGEERIAVYTVGSSWRWTIRGADGKVLRELTSLDGPAGPGTASWLWAKDYIWRDGLLLASQQQDGANTTTYHYHLDHLGTPRRVTDQNDRIVGVHDYFAFGPDLPGGTTESSATTLKYTGHERDDWTAGAMDSLDYMHARYYSAGVGRFLSIDPVIKKGAMGSPQLWNRYTYTANNPINRLDPDGRNWFYIDDQWQWHKGAKYTNNGHTYNSDYTHLLVAQAVGTTKTGATLFRLTLYDQNHVAATGSYFSGGGGHLRIPMGNYTIRGDIRDPHGPTEINSNSPAKNPPVFYGMQVIQDVPLRDSATGVDYDVYGAYGPMRAYLNPWNLSISGSTGNYLHGQAASGPSAHGYTHGCLCYGQDATIINTLWKLGERVPVSIDGSVQKP